jgi:glutamine phosphoribosylpyrophosphate amidotransferase
VRRFNIDVAIPIPDMDIALEVSRYLKSSIQRGSLKIDTSRTFIMPGQKERELGS